jgi:hypothetical protein
MAIGVGSSPRGGAKKTIRNDGLFLSKSQSLEIPNSNIRIVYLTAKSARFLHNGRKDLTQRTLRVFLSET